ncbi:hypothetical protein BCR34DRAFT_385029 [Clohesyomyces aquaticus]|uniref:Uncharacterized protein n=1 Tax=Clohesyomyces aquaticus TaxID=1231657 RepID=A0A1Y1ZFH7_9PLEO|nr:hypothetical protein BCR34DRAFT_385029 [Clohesyomyces aquaticus]
MLIVARKTDDELNSLRQARIDGFDGLMVDAHPDSEALVSGSRTAIRRQWTLAAVEGTGCMAWRLTCSLTATTRHTQQATVVPVPSQLRHEPCPFSRPDWVTRSNKSLACLLNPFHSAKPRLLLHTPGSPTRTRPRTPARIPTTAPSPTQTTCPVGRLAPPSWSRKRARESRRPSPISPPVWTSTPTPPPTRTSTSESSASRNPRARVAAHQTSDSRTGMNTTTARRQPCRQI